MTLVFLSEKLSNCTTRILSKQRERFTGYVAALDAMSPLKVLSRGYSITSDESGKIIKKVSEVSSGTKLGIRLEDGSINCTVD